jgi:hypothetical protein
VLLVEKQWVFAVWAQLRLCKVHIGAMAGVKFSGTDYWISGQTKEDVDSGL